MSVPAHSSSSLASSPCDPASAGAAGVLPHVELVREYRFEAAHQLPKVAPGHRCARLHGHSYRVDVTVAGGVDEESGWVIDFYDMDRAVVPVIEALDHRFLNEIPGLENPTSERLCVYLWGEIAPLLSGLCAITVWETIDSRCTYAGKTVSSR